MFNQIFNSSLYQQKEVSDFDLNKDKYNSPFLREGVVIEMYDIDSKENITKAAPEYNVLCIENSKNSINTTIYKNCLLAQSFGGVADFLEYKLEIPKDSMKVKQQAKFQEQEGSRVIVLFIDGVMDRGIIVGSIGHPKRKTTLTKENEKHLEGEYNGINWQVNKDGEFTLTFKSASDNEGKYKDESSGGSFIKFDKEGSLSFDDKKSNKIKLDKTKEQLDIIIGKKINIKGGDELTIETPKNGTIKVKDLLLEASGKATIKSQSDFTIDSSGKVDIKGKKVTVDASNIDLKGQNVNIQGTKIALGQGGTPALTMSTIFQGVGNLGAPVICTAVSGFSSVVTIAS